MSHLPQRIAPGVYRIGLGPVNAFLIDLDDPGAGGDAEAGVDAGRRAGGPSGGLLLVDTGTEKAARSIGQAILDVGRRPDELRGVVVTHLHRDHTGSLAEIVRRTGVDVWMAPADAAAVRDGVFARPLDPGPGFVRSGVARLVALRQTPTGEPIAVAHEVADGETLPFAGLTAIHTPGHTAGHLALLLPRGGGVLFVGDAATNWGRLSSAPIYENLAQGRESLAKLSALDFEVAAFAHGWPIRKDAAARFRRRWPVAG